MELNYFISGSEAASLSQKDKWLDSSSLVSRSFTRSSSYTLTGISGYSDFSLFFTFDKKDNKAGSILSNIHSTSPRGFSLNFNNNNELFLYSNFKDSDCYTFSNVRLANKNCLAVIKAGQQITILNYDLDSRTVYKEESFSFADTSNISGGNFLIGYNPTVLSRTSLSGVSGIFDQLVCFDAPLEQGDYNSIFSGFLPLQGTFVTTYSPYYEARQIELKENSILSESDAYKLVPFLDYIASSSIPLLPNNYISNITGVANAAQNKIYWGGYYGLSENLLCYPTGSLISINGEYSPYTPAAFNGNLYFNNDINRSANPTGEIISSHLFSFYTTNPEIEDFFSYNRLQKSKSTTTSALVESLGAENYKKTFYMNGIISNNENYCNLFYYPNQSYTGVGRELLFDKSKNLFSLDEYFKSGNNTYWGLSGKISNYTLSNTHIDFTDFVEDNSYPLIYDMTDTDPKALFASKNFSKGDFQRGAAVIFFGENEILRSEYRQRREEFTETSSYHIANSKSNIITLDNASGIYNESTNDYWKYSMRTLDPPAPIV